MNVDMITETSPRSPPGSNYVPLSLSLSLSLSCGHMEHEPHQPS